ncbi:MAG: BatD family protein [Alphaproteobacteria bacterium]
MKTFLKIFLCIIFYTNSVCALEVYTDRNALNLGETLNLTIKADSSDDRPNLSVLQEDFKVVGTSSSSQTNIINGKISSSKSWEIALSPKREGSLTIPSFKVGSKTSQPITIQVYDNAVPANNTKNDAFFMTAEVDNNEPFVQQQIIYTFKIYDGIGLSKISPEEPVGDNLQFIKLGDYDKTSEYIHNRRYDVYSFKYAVFPQKSGELKISPIGADVITGENLGSSLFDFFNNGFNNKAMQVPDIFAMTKSTRVAAGSVKLQVKSKPSNIDSFWRPAKKINLRDAWKPNPPVFKVGEPISRVIAIEGKAVLPEQLPDITAEQTDGIKIYQDKASNETFTDGDDAAALKQQTLVYIPEKAGQASLPEISVLWWDTINNELKKSSLPAMRIQVMPASDSQDGSQQLKQITPDENQEENHQEKDEQDNKENQLNTNQQEPSASATENMPSENSSVNSNQVFYSPYFIAAAIIGGILFGFLAAFLIFNKKTLAISEKSNQEKSANKNSEILSAFNKSCQDNNPKQTRDLLLEWGKAKWPENPPFNVETIAQMLNDDALLDEVKQLERALYIGGDFDGSSLYKTFNNAIKNYQKNKNSQEEAAPIPDLYP